MPEEAQRTFTLIRDQDAGTKDRLMEALFDNPLSISHGGFRNGQALVLPPTLKLLLIQGYHELLVGVLLCQEPDWVDGDVDTVSDPLEPDQRQPAVHCLTERSVFGVIRIAPTPLVSQVAVIRDL